MNNPNRLVTYVAAAAAAGVVLVALGIPLPALWPLALILACPLMMFFMMRGMHTGAGHGAAHDQTRARR